MLDPVSITTTVVGISAIGIMVRRVLTKQDEHTININSLTTKVAVIESKMPNGDWAQIQNDLGIMRKAIEETRGEK